ncbi:hypothetical protein [Streptomyces sp. NPDC056632]|uniref:hypothetical protein n=1 Tax=Streptomyces sp. NPDC056632 TaxID=3345884 RepID=UPI0036C0EFD1
MNSIWTLLAAPAPAVPAVPATGAPWWGVALGTAAGALITGGFLIWSKYREQKAALDLAKVQAHLDVSKWHRTERRTSYANCLISYEKFRDMVAAFTRVIPWQPVPQALTAEQEVELTRLLVKLEKRFEDSYEKCQVVRLEGPPALAHTAKSMALAADSFRAAAKDQAQAAKDLLSTQDERGRERQRAWDHAVTEMDAFLEEFIGLVQQTVAVD